MGWTPGRPALPTQRERRAGRGLSVKRWAARDARDPPGRLIRRG